MTIHNLLVNKSNINGPTSFTNDAAADALRACVRKSAVNAEPFALPFELIYY